MRFLTSSISRTEHVKTYFDDSYYLDNRGFDIRIRAETIEQFTRGKRYRHLLDIGCGDGSISLPLLQRCEHLTLVDLSEMMLSRAARKLPQNAPVELLVGDVKTLDLQRHGYDLILCIGVLAHVDSVESFLKRVVDLLAPEGALILELTDSYHAAGKAIVLYHKLISILKTLPYNLNRLRNGDVIAAMARNGLASQKHFRYCFPPPGSQRIFSNHQLYRAIRMAFGDVADNRNRWLGNEYLHLLQRCS
jgi:2-polyprenyl-3-methyl-5-hydroxy-6-metoxy-1,4-benzoquinol methylase